MTAAAPLAPAVAVLGASGLIGNAVATALMRDGCRVVAVARRFTPAQKASFGAAAVECPIGTLDAQSLARLLSERQVDIVVNCLGVLQDSGRGRAAEIHGALVDRIIAALRALAWPALLVHLSIPGRPEDDRTPFSRTKRAAERAIAAAGLPFVILRPGFVVAPATYGGNALMRALAALPVRLPPQEAERPFAATDIGDIVRTLAVIVRRWRDGARDWAAAWDVMERQPSTVGEVVEAFRRHFGGPRPRLLLLSWLMSAGAGAADLAARLGWLAPIRSTALQEMRRGVEGDPAPWIAATGIEPASLEEALRSVPATVQEKWFARLYLAKPLVIAALALFWIASGLIALTVSFEAAAAILAAHGFAPPWDRVLTIASSLLDIGIGAAIAVRRTCRAGLIAGIGVSLAYMAGAALLAPELWIEPLGALVKTVPAVVLMLVALAILDDR